MSYTKAGFRLFIAGGLCFLAHSAYSTIQYHKHLRTVGEEYSGSPPDILLEVLVGFLLCAFGVFGTADQFLPIKMAQNYEKYTVQDYSFRPEFASFNHRGRFLGKIMFGLSTHLEKSEAKRRAHKKDQ